MPQNNQRDFFRKLTCFKVVVYTYIFNFFFFYKSCQLCLHFIFLRLRSQLHFKTLTLFFLNSSLADIMRHYLLSALSSLYHLTPKDSHNMTLPPSYFTIRVVFSGLQRYGFHLNVDCHYGQTLKIQVSYHKINLQRALSLCEFNRVQLDFLSAVFGVIASFLCLNFLVTVQTD